MIKTFFLSILLSAIPLALLAQTNIRIHLKNGNNFSINKLDAFDLSQKEFTNLEYQPTLAFRFRKTNVDCYNIRYHSQTKMYSQQIWLDTGNISIEAHIDGDFLIIDTVIHSPFYYEVKNFNKEISRLYQNNDTTALNSYLLSVVEKNIDNPFSISASSVYVNNNQNYIGNLLIIKNLLDKQGDKFDWFLLKPSLMAQLDALSKMEEAMKIVNFDFTDINESRQKIVLKGADYYVLDIWNLGCAPCREQHKEIKSDFNKFAQKNIKLIGISNDITKFPSWKDYLLKHGYTWANYLENYEGKRITQELAIFGFPTYIILDKNEKLVGIYNSLKEVKKKLNVD